MKVIYEIQDDKKVLFRGDPSEIMHIWNTTYLADWAFQEIYGHLDRDANKYIDKWEGRLRIACIIDEIDAGPGSHYWPMSMTAGINPPVPQYILSATTNDCSSV